MNLDDKILVEKLSAGSQAAFNALYQKYSGKLYNFVMMISNNNTFQAEEIVQRVFIKIWETRENLDPTKSFNSFLLTIGRNMLFNELNHEMVQFVYAEYVLKNQNEDSRQSEKSIEFDSLKDYLDTLLEQLTPARREVFILSRMENLTVKEIAQRLNKSEKTIEKQLAQGNSFIREQLKKHYDKIFMLVLGLFLH